MEVLKSAVERAWDARSRVEAGRYDAHCVERAAAEQPEPAQPPGGLEASGARALWSSLPLALATAGAATRGSATGAARPVFAELAARVLGAMAQNGWRHVGVTSPGRGAGRTTVAANLALGLAARRGCRTVLLDLDLAAPGQAAAFGLEAIDWPMARFLSGAVPSAAFLRRTGVSLAVGLNGERAAEPEAVLSDPRTGARIEAMTAELAPGAVVSDLPPLLDGGAALGLLDSLDAVLLVLPAGRAEAAEVEAAERLIAESTAAFLGVVLNAAGKAGRPHPDRR